MLNNHYNPYIEGTVVCFHLYFISFQIIMPGLLEGITKNFTNTAEEKFNTMHSTFLVIQHSTTKNPAIGLQLFSDLSSVPMHSESMVKHTANTPVTLVDHLSCTVIINHNSVRSVYPLYTIFFSI